MCRLFHFCPICLPNSMRCLCMRNEYLCVIYVATYICPVRCIVLSACDSHALVPAIYCSWYATCPAVPISTVLYPCVLCVVPTCMYLLWHICAFLCSVCALHSLLRPALSTALFTPLCTLHSALHSSLHSVLSTPLCIPHPLLRRGSCVLSILRAIYSRVLHIFCDASMYLL